MEGLHAGCFSVKLGACAQAKRIGRDKLPASTSRAFVAGLDHTSSAWLPLPSYSKRVHTRSRWRCTGVRERLICWIVSCSTCPCGRWSIHKFELRCGAKAKWLPDSAASRRSSVAVVNLSDERTGSRSSSSLPMHRAIERLRACAAVACGPLYALPADRSLR